MGHASKDHHASFYYFCHLFYIFFPKKAISVIDYDRQNMENNLSKYVNQSNTYDMGF